MITFDLTSMILNNSLVLLPKESRFDSTTNLYNAKLLLSLTYQELGSKSDSVAHVHKDALRSDDWEGILGL